jgi:hypothetical protein
MLLKLSKEKILKFHTEIFHVYALSGFGIIRKTLWTS